MLIASLVGWHDYFALVGGGSANLMGLMFVALSIGYRAITEKNVWLIHVFATPAIIHFTVVLVISAIVQAPQHHPMRLAMEIGALGLAGTAYTLLWVLPGLRTVRKEKLLAGGQWMQHVVAPAVSYSLILLSGALILGRPGTALSFLAASTMLLQLLGIRQAWTTVIIVATKTTDIPGGANLGE